MDYRKLLQRYMDFVRAEEGIDFTDTLMDHGEFTASEAAVLRYMSAENHAAFQRLQAEAVRRQEGR